jgi:hypothetical protein
MQPTSKADALDPLNLSVLNVEHESNGRRRAETVNDGRWRRKEGKGWMVKTRLEKQQDETGSGSFNYFTGCLIWLIITFKTSTIYIT